MTIPFSTRLSHIPRVHTAAIHPSTFTWERFPEKEISLTIIILYPVHSPSYNNAGDLVEMNVLWERLSKLRNVFRNVFPTLGETTIEGQIMPMCIHKRIRSQMYYQPVGGRFLC